MKSPEMAISGRAARILSMVREIGFDRMTAVHRLQDAVAARLHRKVEVGHQLVDLAGAAISASVMSAGWLVV